MHPFVSWHYCQRRGVHCELFFKVVCIYVKEGKLWSFNNVPFQKKVSFPMKQNEFELA